MKKIKIKINLFVGFGVERFLIWVRIGGALKMWCENFVGRRLRKLCRSHSRLYDC